MINNRRIPSNKGFFVFTLDGACVLRDITVVTAQSILSGTKTEAYKEPPSEKVITIRGGSENGAIIGEGEVIKVNVKWDGSEESFELHNKAK